ncbi:sugar phosphate isomerase/epimerase [bacterium]|nr:sugar phosphate isomerase/epimerase [bacterium]
MLIGMMNNPQKNLMSEVAYAAAQGFDFIDYTMEPPGGILAIGQVSEITTILRDSGMGIVGHTAWYLPVDSPFKKLRSAVVAILKEQLDLFAELGIEKVTLHAGFSYPHRFFTYSEKLAFWVDALSQLVEIAAERQINLMLENVPGNKDHFRILRDLLRKFQDIGFHLDVGHANLLVPVNVTYEYLKRFKQRLMHIHLSDNFARGNDLHLPIGAGGIPWKNILKLIKGTGYDETFTLEVFSTEREYLLKSREILRSLWNEVN